jgi:hypothetical protein
MEGIKIPGALDVRIEPNGSVTLVRPLTLAGQEWLDDNTATEEWQWFGGALAVEPRYVADLAEGMTADGLTIKIKED